MTPEQIRQALAEVDDPLGRVDGYVVAALVPVVSRLIEEATHGTVSTTYHDKIVQTFADEWAKSVAGVRAERDAAQTELARRLSTMDLIIEVERNAHDSHVTAITAERDAALAEVERQTALILDLYEACWTDRDDDLSAHMREKRGDVDFMAAYIGADREERSAVEDELRARAESAEATVARVEAWADDVCWCRACGDMNEVDLRTALRGDAT